MKALDRDQAVKLVELLLSNDNELYKSLESKIKDIESGKEVTSDSRIPQKLKVTKVKTEYDQGETLDMSDLVAVCTYTTGEEEEVSSYTTNSNEIDMNYAGTKLLEVTYKHNGISVSDTISVKVNFSE